MAVLSVRLSPDRAADAVARGWHGASRRRRAGRHGAAPGREHAEVEALRRREELLAAIDRPLTDEEAAALVGLFGPDDCYGAAWSIRHLVETAPSWPIASCLRDTGNEWIRTLRRRAQNAGLRCE